MNRDITGKAPARNSVDEEPALLGRVAIVDDDEPIMHLLTALCRGRGHEAFGFSTAADLMSSIDEIRPDCIISDLRMPEIDGFGLISWLRNSRYSGAKLIMVSAYIDVELTVRAMKMGAYTVVLKPFSNHMMLNLVDQAIRENDELSRSSPSLIESRFGSLTPREQEIAKLVADGMITVEIANVLDISPRTVEVFRSRILKKMAARNSAALVAQMAELRD